MGQAHLVQCVPVINPVTHQPYLKAVITTASSAANMFIADTNHDGTADTPVRRRHRAGAANSA